MWRTALLILATAAVSATAIAARARSGVAPMSAAPPTDRPPMRIISLAPALTETCCALGLTDRLVGRSTFCDDPPTVVSLPDVGGLLDPNLERIVSLQPDLILVPATARDLRGLLNAAGLSYLALPNDGLDDVFESIRVLGESCGQADAAGRLEADLRRRILAVQHRRPAAAPRRALISISASRIPMQPPYVAGPGSYLDSLLRLAGHENALVGETCPYVEISFEHVLRIDPDVIIEIRGLAGEPPDAVADPLRAWASLGDLTAVRNGRVHALHGAQHVIPGPRVVETLDALARLLDR